MGRRGLETELWVEVSPGQEGARRCQQGPSCKRCGQQGGKAGLPGSGGGGEGSGPPTVLSGYRSPCLEDSLQPPTKAGDLTQHGPPCPAGALAGCLGQRLTPQPRLHPRAAFCRFQGAAHTLEVPGA